MAVGGAGRPPALGPARVRVLRRINALFQAGTLVAAGLILAAVASIVGVLLSLSGAFLLRAGPGFLFGSDWDPTHGIYGAWPFLVGTVEVSGLALLLAVPVSLAVAIFLSDLGPRWLVGPLAQLVDLLATVPSVVFGIWGYFVVAPFLQQSVDPALARVTGGTLLFSNAGLTQLNLFAAAVVLALMVIPTVAALSREALRAVPRVQREAALGLGATRSEVVRLAVLGPATPGIVSAILLGLGRALGETIAVTLLIGNGEAIPTSLFSTANTIPSVLANQVADAPNRAPLLELGLILLVLTVAVNLGARALLRVWTRSRGRRRHLQPTGASARLAPVGHRLAAASAGDRTSWRASVPPQPARRQRRRVLHLGVLAVTIGATALALFPLASIVVTAAQGSRGAVLSPAFYTTQFPPDCAPGFPSPCSVNGIGPAIVGTGYLLAIAAAIAVPLGILAGVYLAEFRRGLVSRSLSFLTEIMVGIPSILIGLTVYVSFLAIDRSYAETLLTGGIALSILMFPLVARTTEEALRAVPAGVRESAIALGFPRYRVATRVTLRTARSGIVTGVLLALARASGDTAALLFTAGWWGFWPPGLLSPSPSLAVLIYNNLQNASTYPNAVADAWGGALVLLALMLGIGLVARLGFARSGTASGA